MSNIASLFRVPKLSYRVWKVWMRNWDVFMKTYKTNFLPSLLEPVLYLLALGFGLGGHTATQFADLTSQIVEKTGISVFAIGFGDGVDADQLNAIAQNGGTDFTTYFDAADGTALETALNTIGESVHVSCSFEIGTFDNKKVDLNLVNIYFDGTGVPRNDNCAVEGGEGWTWTDDTRTAFEFCENTCDALQSGDAEDLSIEIMCSEEQIIVI